MMFKSGGIGDSKTPSTKVLPTAHSRNSAFPSGRTSVEQSPLSRQDILNLKVPAALISFTTASIPSKRPQTSCEAVPPVRLSLFGSKVKTSTRKQRSSLQRRSLNDKGQGVSVDLDTVLTKEVVKAKNQNVFRVHDQLPVRGLKFMRRNYQHH